MLDKVTSLCPRSVIFAREKKEISSLSALSGSLYVAMCHSQLFALFMKCHNAHVGSLSSIHCATVSVLLFHSAHFTKCHNTHSVSHLSVLSQISLFSLVSLQYTVDTRAKYPLQYLINPYDQTFSGKQEKRFWFIAVIQVMKEQYSKRPSYLRSDDSELFSA